MKKVLSLSCALCLLFLSLSAGAQEPAEMADTMRSNGKIYVLVAIMLVVLAGLIIYLVIIDRKVGKIEKDLRRKP